LNIHEIRTVIRNEAETEYHPVRIELAIFEEESGLSNFNSIIRHELANRRGVYIWENADNGEVIYVGMAGKICQNGEFTNHDIQRRMLASRGRDLANRRDIQTNAYIKLKMQTYNISRLNIHPLYTYDRVLPGYVEAVILNCYFQINGRLPLLNSHF
jgi:hypothetical protein